MESTIRKLDEKGDKLQSSIGPELEKASKRLSDLNESIVAFIRERPGTCLLGALAAGFIIGKIAAKR